MAEELPGIEVLNGIDGLVYEVVRLGHRLGVPVPNYEEIAGSLLLRLKNQ